MSSSRGAVHSAIKVSSIYEKKGKALGAILAHEITHFVLNTRGVSLPNTDENERLTDLASIMLGLGKLILNGKEERTTYSVSTLGYLSFSELAYAYEEQNAIRGVAPNICLSNLTDEASAQVRPLLWQREQEWKKDQGKISAFSRRCLGSFKLIEKIEKLYQRLVENQRWINENIHTIKIVDTQGNIFVQLNNYIFEQHFNIFIQLEKDKLADIKGKIPGIKTFVFNAKADVLRKELEFQIEGQIKRIKPLLRQFQRWVRVQERYTPKVKGDIKNKIFRIFSRKEIK